MGLAERGTRGQTLANARDFCVERRGRDAWERVRETLSKETAAAAEGADRGTWYPITIYTELHDAIAKVLGAPPGDFAIMKELGYYAAEYDVTKTMRLFLRVARPSWLMHGYGTLWTKYHGSGRWQMLSGGPRRLQARLTGWETTSEAACVSVAAFVERFLQLVGGEGARVTRPRCAQRGDPFCEYICRWD